MESLRDRARDRAEFWAVAMTGQPSVTGTDGERRFGPWLADRLAECPAFGKAEVWTIPVGDADGRACVAMLLRGQGQRTLVLTGHYDTVSADDYGELSELATEPDRLKEALCRRLAARAETPAELRARDDLAGDAFLPGRGLLDMKAGLAAGLAAAEAFAATPGAQGNILFLAVPDEERYSAGARRAAQALPAVAAERGLDLVAAINLDAMADDGDGGAGRIVALGTVGKLLPTAFVVGIPTHGCYPFAGVNAAAIAAAIAARIEWAPELTDDLGAEPGTPPSLLGIRDGKPFYDVTTPATAFASWNVLIHVRTPADILAAFDRLCAEAAEDCLAAMTARAAGSRAIPTAGRGASLPRAVAVHRFEAVAAAARGREPRLEGTLAAFRRELAAGGLALPEQCRLVTERVWAASGLPGPAVVTGFGSMPYLPVSLSAAPEARRLGRAARAAAAAAERRYGAPVACIEHFPAISDVSFFGEADEASLGVVRANTPVSDESVPWPERGGIAGVPTINVGPWGRDYHTPLERLHAGYAWEVLPRLLLDIAADVLESDGR